MFDNLFIKMHVALLAFAAVLTARTRRVASPRRGAEFIEVALYAAIILAIALIFRTQLVNAFNALLGRIQAALQ